MGKEAILPDPYESLIRTKEGSLIRESEFKKSKKETSKEKPEEEVINTGRRHFLVGLSGAAIGLVAGKELIQHGTERFADKVQDYLAGIKHEKEPVYLTPTEQLTKFGKIKNLSTAIETIQKRHYEYLTKTGRGQRDMKEAVENLSTLDMERFTEPFKEQDIPQQFAYMIAIQETRGRVESSWAGARGIMGIMPETARHYGYEPSAVDDPYVATTVAAKYLREEKTRFGDDVDMLLHAYNGGGSLFAFSSTTPKGERTAENFYTYMEAYMNTRYDEARERGYFEYRIRKGDTLSKLTKEYQVALLEMFSENGMNEQTILHVREKIRIPFHDDEDHRKILFRKELEVLHYAPEVEAKYEALREQGFIAQLESDLPEKTKRFG